MATLDPTGLPDSSIPDDPELSAMLDDLDRKADADSGSDAGPDVVAQARESLEETIRGLKLTPDEERAVAEELRQLRDLTRKLDETTVEIAAFGMVSRGKSSVLNALLGQNVFKTGTTHGTTVVKAQQAWEQVAAERPGLGGAKLILVDTPGIDEVGGEVRETMAREVARHADLILFVVSSDLQRLELEALSQLRNCQKPILVVFNQIDRYPDADRDQIYNKIKDERVRDLVRPEDVVMTTARPDPYKVKIQLPDGTTRFQWERPAPLIEPLKVRVLDVLEREGKALVALNTLLTAGDLHEEIVAHKLRIRESAANRLIRNFCLAKGVAVGLNPIPVADMAGGLAVDVGMIVALSRVYGIPLTKKTATGLVREMMVALGAMGMVELATRLLASGVKSSLAGLSVLSGGLALPLTALGYGAVGLALGGSAATTTYVLGHGAKVYLKQGCQWGPRGIKTVIHQIVAQARTDSVIERLRDDLKKRITG
jgi:GTPase